MHTHAKACWGGDVIKSASRAGTAELARSILARKNLKNGSITAAFEREGKAKVSYSHTPHTSAQSRYALC